MYDVKKREYLYCVPLKQMALHNVLFKPSVCESEERNKLAYREQLEQLVSVDELKGCKVVDELV